MQTASPSPHPAVSRVSFPEIVALVVMLLLTGGFILDRLPVLPAIGGGVLGVIIGGFLLCAVVDTYNSLRSSEIASRPSLAMGMAVILVAGLINSSLVAIVPFVADAINIRESTAFMFAAAGPLPAVSILVLGVCLRRILPTTAKHGMLIALLFASVWVIIGLAACGIWLGLGGDFRF